MPNIIYSTNHFDTNDDRTAHCHFMLTCAHSDDSCTHDRAAYCHGRRGHHKLGVCLVVVFFRGAVISWPWVRLVLIF